jgi:hypothetical protein
MPKLPRMHRDMYPYCSVLRDWEKQGISPVHGRSQTVVRQGAIPPRSAIPAPIIHPWMRNKDLP